MARCAVRSLSSDSDPSTKTTTAEDPAPSKTLEEQEEDSGEEHVRLQISVGKEPKATKGTPEDDKAPDLLAMAKYLQATVAKAAPVEHEGLKAEHEAVAQDPEATVVKAAAERVQDLEATVVKAAAEHVEDPQDAKAAATAPDGAPEPVKHKNSSSQADATATKEDEVSQGPKAAATAPDGAPEPVKHKGSNPQAEATATKEDDVSQGLKAAVTAFVAAAASFKAASIALRKVMADKSASVKSEVDPRLTPAHPRLPRRRGTRISISQQFAAQRRFLVNHQQELKLFMVLFGWEVDAVVHRSHRGIKNILICFTAVLVLVVPAFFLGVEYAKKEVVGAVKDMVDSDFTDEKLEQYIKSGKAKLNLRPIVHKAIFGPDDPSPAEKGKKEEKKQDEKKSTSLSWRNPFSASPTAGPEKGKEEEKGEEKEKVEKENNSWFGWMKTSPAPSTSTLEKGQEKEKAKEKKEKGEKEKVEKENNSWFGWMKTSPAPLTSTLEKGQEKEKAKEKKEKAEEKKAEEKSSWFSWRKPPSAPPSPGFEKGQEKEEKAEQKKEKADEKKEKAKEKSSWFSWRKPPSAPLPAGIDGDNK